MWLGNHFSESHVRLKGQRSRSPGRFTHRGVYAQAAAAVSVGTYWAWENAATLPSADAAVGSATRGATAPRRGGEGRGISCRHAHSLFKLWKSRNISETRLIKWRTLYIRLRYGLFLHICVRENAMIRSRWYFRCGYLGTTKARASGSDPYYSPEVGQRSVQITGSQCSACCARFVGMRYAFYLVIRVP